MVESYKKPNYIQIAHQLGYSRECIEKIKRAKTDIEKERILHDERVKSGDSNKEFLRKRKKQIKKEKQWRDL